MFKHFIISFLAKRQKRAILKWAKKPIESQKEILKKLINSANKTVFGRDHNFNIINSYNSFKKNIPIVDYEKIKPYINKIIQGETDVLWPGRPKYFAVTSGTTSGSKYIPITKESLPNLLDGAKNALLMYIANTGNTKALNGKHIFLQGSPILAEKGGIKTGRLSGISAYHVPFFLRFSRLPSHKTNCIKNWEEKVEAIVKETITQDVRIFSGIPSWLQMYFEKLQESEKKSIGEIFKNFQLLIYGGVSYAPYKKKFEKLFGRKIDSIEVYPASEGFFAFQDQQSSKDLLLIVNSGIFYEFIKEQDFLESKYDRISLEEVEIATNYVLIISTSAGLWGYNTGDTIKFTSKTPYKIIVTGRIKQFISAFGEHVIVKEAEQAIKKATTKTKAIVNEFTVAPQFKTTKSLPRHQWFIEFDTLPKNFDKFVEILDLEMQNQNKYYKDLIKGGVISRLEVKKIKKNGFNVYMKSIGRLGGQNKIPKISNDRKIADKFENFNLIS